MKKKLFSVAQLMNDTAFLKKVEDAIFTLMPDNENGKVVIVNSIGLGYKRGSELDKETFFINATVNSQTLSFSSAIDCKTGEIISSSTGLTAYNDNRFNCQYDVITESLVGGYASDNTYNPDFWLSGVPVSDVQDAIKYCESHLEDEEIIVGDWKQLKNA